MIRAVLDCNVFVSALLAPAGPPGRVVRSLAEGSFEVVVSSAIIEELRRSVGYRKVRTRLGMSEEDLDLLVAAVEVLGVHVTPREIPAVVRDDPDDDIYFAAALEGRAEYIVSGDAHLLDVGEYESVAVLSPRAFLDILRR